MGETVQRLSSGREQHEQLVGLSQQHKAQQAGRDQSDVSKAIKSQNDAIRGTGAAMGELSEPHLVLASPAGIETSTSKSTHIQSDMHTALSTGEHLSIATGKSLFASITEKLSLFVQNAGMKLFSAKGKVEIQAQSDNIEIIAEQVLKLISTKLNIEISADKEILLNAGGSFIRISAKGIEQGTNGSWIAHAASHAMPGPQNLEQSFAAMPVGELGPHSLRFAFAGADEAAHALGLSDKKYRIINKLGLEVAAGIIGAGGRLPRFDFPDSEHLTLHIGEDLWRNVKIEHAVEDIASPLAHDSTPDESDPFHALLGQMEDDMHFAISFA